MEERGWFEVEIERREREREKRKKREKRGSKLLILSISPTPHTQKTHSLQGFYVFIRAVQTLTQHNKGGVIVVGLAGPSGSGKTVFSHKVQSLIPGCALLSMDDYNDASCLVDGNFDDPRLTDYDTLLANVADLKSGKATRAPIYDFKQSRRVGFREVAVPEARVVIVEGIYALSSRIRPLLDLRVSVTGGVHFDLVKRVLRDITRSGQEPEAIIQQISDTVYPMYKAYIEPDLKSAHLRIYNTFNPFTGFMDATYILKSDVAVTDEQVLAVLGGGANGNGNGNGGARMVSCESGAATPTAVKNAAAAASSSSPLSPVSFSTTTPQSALGAAGSAAAVAAPPASAPSTISSSSLPAVAPSASASPRSGSTNNRISRDESETYDIYLLPPNEDPETCSSWLRMRNRDGRYSLMFEEWVVDGPFIISPRITFEVGVRVLGGLMALGYEIGTIMRRTSRAFSNGHLTVKFDDIEGMGRTFVQVQGKDRAAVAAAGAALGLEGSYSPKSYIEMVQLEKLTESFRTVTDDLRRRFAVGGEPLFDAEGLGTPPSSGGGSFNGNGGAFGLGGGGVGTGRGRGRGGGGGGGRGGTSKKNQEAPSFTRTTGFNPTPQQQEQQQQSRPLTLAQSAPTNGSSALLARLEREGVAGSSDDDERRGGGSDSSSCSSSDDESGASPHHRRHFSAAKAAAKKALVESEKQEELKRQRREAARRSTGSGMGTGVGSGGNGAGGSNSSSRSSSDPGGNNENGNGGGGGQQHQHSQQHQLLQSAALRLATGTPVPPSSAGAAAAAAAAAEGRISPLSQRSDGSSDVAAAAAAAGSAALGDGGGGLLHQQLHGIGNGNGNRLLLGSLPGSGGGNNADLLLPSPSPSLSSTTDAQAALADAMARLAATVDSVDRRSSARVAWASGALGAAVGAGVAMVLAKAMK